ncbi:MAG: hypothetical protein AB7F41_14625 [Methylocystis sp.]|uniref:hypothetical protein n=1 Tax=Methylocystis sp. TaxID=1911079 RepID=UPI003D0E4653
MSSETEKAMLALKAALDASEVLPTVRRDPVFDEVFDELSICEPPYAKIVALRHGEPVETTRRFGGGPEAYELVRNAEIEIYVAGPESEGLNAAFDAGVSAVYDAIPAQEIDGVLVPCTLGGKVVAAEIVEPPTLGTDIAGSKAVLTALIRVQLTYLSPRSY